MYMAWQLIEDKASRLDDPILTAEFDFWERVINDINQTQPRSWTCYLDTQRRLGMSVSRPYIARQYPSSTTSEVEAITKDMRGAFSRRIAASDWIDAQTQGEAQSKLASIGDKIGHPDHWPTLDGLSLSGTFLEFDLEMDRWSSQHNLDSRAQPFDHGLWSTPPITVNAFYSDGDNAITIPAGILQPPFFGHGYSAVSNYGAIGAVLGHELTHGFDNRGRLFDSTGVLRDWWTPDTAAAFDARAQCVVDQYSAYTVLPGLNIDGRQTLPENLADIGGLNLAYDAWVASGRHEGDRGGLDDRQQFFVAFAQMWCQVARDELLISSVATDVHSPSHARVNLTMSNVPGAAQAFSCAAGTPLAPAEPCQIW
jgi:predicted metalloendopeptidase